MLSVHFHRFGSCLKGSQPWYCGQPWPLSCPEVHLGPCPTHASCPRAQELRPTLGCLLLAWPCCKCACLQSCLSPGQGWNVCWVELVFAPCFEGSLGMGLGLVQPLVVPGAAGGVHCQPRVGSVVLRGCAVVGEGTACAGIILGSQLIPPWTAVELPAVWDRCAIIGTTLLC